MFDLCSLKAAGRVALGHRVLLQLLRKPASCDHSCCGALPDQVRSVYLNMGPRVADLPYPGVLLVARAEKPAPAFAALMAEAVLKSVLRCYA